MALNPFWLSGHPGALKRSYLHAWRLLWSEGFFAAISSLMSPHYSRASRLYKVDLRRALGTVNATNVPAKPEERKSALFALWIIVRLAFHTFAAKKIATFLYVSRRLKRYTPNELDVMASVFLSRPCPHFMAFWALQCVREGYLQILLDQRPAPAHTKVLLILGEARAEKRLGKPMHTIDGIVFRAIGVGQLIGKGNPSKVEMAQIARIYRGAVEIYDNTAVSPALNTLIEGWRELAKQFAESSGATDQVDKLTA